MTMYMLTGSLMVGGRLGQYLIDLLTTLMGRVHGGPAQVGVLSSTIFGGVSGSAVADASAIGSMLIPWISSTINCSTDGHFASSP